MREALHKEKVNSNASGVWPWPLRPAGSEAQSLNSQSSAHLGAASARITSPALQEPRFLAADEINRSLETCQPPRPEDKFQEEINT